MVGTEIDYQLQTKGYFPRGISIFLLETKIKNRTTLILEELQLNNNISRQNSLLSNNSEPKIQPQIFNRTIPSYHSNLEQPI